MVSGTVMELENAAPEIKQIAIEREENDADMDDEVRSKSSVQRGQSNKRRIQIQFVPRSHFLLSTSLLSLSLSLSLSLLHS